jgi:TonB-linked SusC/RagA family outer membrane protein
MRISILGVFTFFAFSLAANSQNAKVDIRINNQTIQQVLTEIEKQTGYLFVYDKNEVDLNKRVTLRAKNESVKEVLNDLFAQTDIVSAIEGRNIVLMKKDRSSSTSTVQQQNRKTVTGQVLDGNNQPVIGANIIEEGAPSNGTITDIDGYFSLQVAEDAILKISYIGYLSQDIPVSGKNNVSVILQEDTKILQEVIVVGYGTQRKETLTGSVSAISAKDIVTTKNENAQNLITGKIPGVRVVQKSSEPGAFNNNFDIRGLGSPLIVIDGIPRANTDFQRLDPNDIESISVLKDASAAIYGVRAANGVVLVTTKKGTVQKSELTYNGSFTWQIPSGLPSTVDAIDYMTLRNERAMHNLNGGTPLFHEEDFEAYRSGKKISTDWYPFVFAPSAAQTMHNLSATGGNEKIKYYAGIGYQYQNGFFKSNDLNYRKYNIRSNITAKITDRLTFDANINLIMDEQKRPYEDSFRIIRSFWRQGPHIPAYANNDPGRPYHGEIEGDNPISFMDADIVGSKKYNNKWIQPALSITYEIPGIEGLTAKTLLSYDYTTLDANEYQKQYNQYRYDESSKTFQTFSRQQNNLRRATYMDSQLLTQTSLNYKRRFNDKHNVESILVWETQKKEGDTFEASRNLIFQYPYLFAGFSEDQIGSMNPDELYEYTNLALAGRLKYDYADKYFAEFLFRNDGSSKFSQRKRWGFFPGISGAWRISEENFFKNALPFIQQLKLRASYGVTGDDSAVAYQYLTGYIYRSGGDRRNFTDGYVFGGNFYGSTVNTGIPNPDLTWFTAKTFDIGIDFSAWNGLLGVTVDYFSRKRDGLLAKRDGGIPTVVGAALPEENINSDLTYGTDMEISHRNRISDFNYGLKGIFSITRIKRSHVESSPYGNSWSNWKGNQNDRIQGQHWGYEGAGRFESWEQIWNSPTYISRGTIIGDYIYEDWNGDGEINDNDKHPIRFNQTPWVNFSLVGDASYKGFDLNFLLQGSALGSLEYGEQLREPMWGNDNSGAMEQFMNRWHPQDPLADPYDPATQWVSGHFAYTGTLPDAGSSFNVENASYLRLKSIELGYNLPITLLSKTGVSNLRVYVNGYNLLTLTKVKYVDPEHPNDSWGYLYPLNKTVSVGMNITF